MPTPFIDFLICLLLSGTFTVKDVETCAESALSYIPESVPEYVRWNEYFHATQETEWRVLLHAFPASRAGKVFEHCVGSSSDKERHKLAALLQGTTPPPGSETMDDRASPTQDFIFAAQSRASEALLKYRRAMYDVQFFRSWSEQLRKVKPDAPLTKWFEGELQIREKNLKQRRLDLAEFATDDTIKSITDLLNHQIATLDRLPIAYL